MRRMQNQFKCNTCEKWVSGVVLIADNREEFDKIMSQIPPLTVQLGTKLIFAHDCPEESCSGKVNVVYAIADF